MVAATPPARTVTPWFINVLIPTIPRGTRWLYSGGQRTKNECDAHRRVCRHETRGLRCLHSNSNHSRAENVGIRRTRRTGGGTDSRLRDAPSNAHSHVPAVRTRSSPAPRSRAIVLLSPAPGARQRARARDCVPRPENAPPPCRLAARATKLLVVVHVRP